MRRSKKPSTFTPNFSGFRNLFKSSNKASVSFLKIIFSPRLSMFNLNQTSPQSSSRLVAFQRLLSLLKSDLEVSISDFHHDSFKEYFPFPFSYLFALLENLSCFWQTSLHFEYLSILLKNGACLFLRSLLASLFNKLLSKVSSSEFKFYS